MEDDTEREDVVGRFGRAFDEALGRCVGDVEDAVGSRRMREHRVQGAAESEIAQEVVALRSGEDVFRCDILVDETVAMQVRE
jgi:hypothetical protein